MARISFNQIGEFSQQGGGNYFKLNNGQEAVVRILYNTYEDMVPFVCHEVRENGGYARVDCPRQPGSPLDECDYCKAGQKPVVRVVVPLFNTVTNQIEYWVKSGQWVEKEMQPLTDEVVKLGKSIASQQYKIKRIGDGLDTKYSLIPVGVPDDTTKESYGEIKDPIADLKMIKEANYHIPLNQGQPQYGNTQYGNTQYGGQPQQGMNGQFQATRRTTDVF